MDVAVRAGMLNIFQHDLWHLVLPVQGPTRKYGIRLMLLYELGQDWVQDVRLSNAMPMHLPRTREDVAFRPLD